MGFDLAISKGSRKKIVEEIRKTRFHRMTTADIKEIANLLNPKIRGWANYYRTVVAKAAFGKIDNAIYLAIMKWFRRRHSGRARRKLVARYFRCRGGSRRWIFSSHYKGRNGNKILACLVKMMDITIQRHVKIRSEVNPFDLQYKHYLEERKLWKIKVSERQKRKDRRNYLRIGPGVPVN